MKMMMLFVTAITVVGCTDEGTPPEPYQPTIELSLEDRGTTDAWMHLRFSGAPPYSFRLVRDGQSIATVASSPSDTLLVDEPLLPNRSYTYRAYRISGTAVTDSSRAVHVTTLDSTSSAWQWALDTLGVMNSYLADCAIIAPDDIWVVGTIYARDSLGNVEDVPHNAARWDGTRWNLLRALFPICGPDGNEQGTSPADISGIFAFSQNDVWLASATSLVHWNGQAFQRICMTLGYGERSFNKLWGINGRVYVVGSNGFIAFYDGTTWQRQESGTGLALSDVHGTTATELYAVGLNNGQLRGVVLRNNGQAWQIMIEGFPTGLVDSSELFRTKIYGTTEGVWLDERRTLYTVGNLMYRYRHGTWDYVRSLPGNCPGCNPNFLHTGYLYAVRGNSSNDIVIAGAMNTLRHFNGVRWSEVGLPYYPLKPDIFWYQCSIKENTAVGVGKIPLNLNRGIVMRLWR